MEALQNRIDSFAKQKRVKNTKKTPPFLYLKWPHPSNFIATPKTLAEAGFYFNPSIDDRDNVTCYICKKQLSDWEAEDDPFDIHWEKCGSECCWASVRCGLRGDMDQHGGFVFIDKNRLPTSKNMERARLETFAAGSGWIHDKEKNHGANSRKMARAGFVYSPQHPEDDLATCLYCNVSLSGWDIMDDPTEEHRKRGKKSGYMCPFFTVLELASKPPSRAQSQHKPVSKIQPQSMHTRSVSISNQQALVPPIHDSDNDSNEDSTLASTKRRTKVKDRVVSDSTIGLRSKHARGQSRSVLGNVTEHNEDAEEDEETVLIGKARRATKAPARTKTHPRTKSVSRPVISVPNDEGENDVVIEKTILRSRSKAKATVSTEDEAEDVKVLKKSTRGRGVVRAVEVGIDEVHARKPSHTRKAKAFPEPTSESEQNLEEFEKGNLKAQPRARAKPVPRKPSRAKPKAMAPATEDVIASEVETEEDGKGDIGMEKDTLSSIPSSTTRATQLSKGKAKSGAQLQRADMADENSEVIEDAPGEVVTSQDNFGEENETHTCTPVVSPSSPSTFPLQPPITSCTIPYVNQGEGEHELTQELAPLFIPKRDNKVTGKTDVTDTERPAQGSKKSGVKTTGKQTPSFQGQDVKQNAKRKMKEKEMGGSKKASSIKIVEISTDEDEQGQRDKEETRDEPEQHREQVRKTKVIEEKQEKDAVMRNNSAVKPRPREKMQVFVEIEQPPKVKRAGIPSKQSPSPSIHQLPVLESEDIEMPGIDDQEHKGGNVTSLGENPPTTPIRDTNSSRQSPSLDTVTDPPAFFPPLSKLPFTPLQNLTEAELDMTVEEWIRYQMEVEYDKFRRDGERELARFKRRAEEVRGIIEEL